MKTNQIVYWVSTGVLSLLMLLSGVSYFANPSIAESFQHLGFPDYFRVELGIAKLLGAVVLLIPKIFRQLKEWAYAGFGITFLSASYSHIQSGDPVSLVVPPIVFFGILVLSYVYFQKQTVKTT
ncbi:DoxX family protein [Leptospira sp. 96542]|nr:DoxX family protein [Leptospira sp. 96542]